MSRELGRTLLVKGQIERRRKQKRAARDSTELRVAELAATGLTDKRIAETVFLSAKTVEANLARIT